MTEAGQQLIFQGSALAKVASLHGARSETQKSGIGGTLFSPVLMTVTRAVAKVALF